MIFFRRPAKKVAAGQVAAGGMMERSSGLRSSLAGALAVALALVLFSSDARAQISPRDSKALSPASLIYIATVRKDGNQSKAAPVWFTLGADNNSILIQTGPQTWKAKRIRRGSPALIWIGAASGPAFIGQAEITSDAAIQTRILDDFRKKYLANRLLGVGPSRAKFDSGAVIAIKITPVRDLPDGFVSTPGTPAPPLQAGAPGPAASPAAGH
jgi:predicted pyridoxine 5'-phosphate oxidase superfamily flavin-nucleotide-binding protein